MPSPFCITNLEKDMTNKERIEKSTDRVKVTIARLEHHRELHDDEGLSDIDYESIYKKLNSALDLLSNGTNTWSSPNMKLNRVLAAIVITETFLLIDFNSSIQHSTWEALEALIA